MTHVTCGLEEEALLFECVFASGASLNACVLAAGEGLDQSPAVRLPGNILTRPNRKNCLSDNTTHTHTHTRLSVV